MEAQSQPSGCQRGAAVVKFGKGILRGGSHITQITHGWRNHSLLFTIEHSINLEMNNDW